MLIACWSVKGGVGVSVVAASIALSAVGAVSHAREAVHSGEVLLVDLGGDLPTLLGIPDQPVAGVGDWLAAGPDVPADGLVRLEVPVTAGLTLLPRGIDLPQSGDRADLLVDLLAADGRTVVVDCGAPFCSGAPMGPAEELGRLIAGGASRSLLVVRPCMLSLRRALQAPLRPSGLVVVAETGRALAASDVEEVVGVPVVAEVAVDPKVARLVDAGLFVARAPRGLLERVRRAA